MFDIGSFIPSIIGLGTKIGTAVPGLKKPKKGRAGQAAATQAAHRVASAAVGGAQAGHGASRGLALREGLRAAAQQAAHAATAQGAAARADEDAYQRAKTERNARLASFGTDLAKGLGDMAALGIKPKAEDAEREPVEVSETGFGEAAPVDDSASLEDLEQQQLAQEDVEQQALIDDASRQLDDFRTKREEAGVDLGGPQAAFQEEPTAALIEQASPLAAPEIEQQLADKLHMKELALAEAERLGLGLDVVIPRLNRRLGLRPGQSTQNPFGISPDMGEDEGTA